MQSNSNTIHRSVSDWPLHIQYALAIWIVAVAIGLRWLLDPLLGERVPYVTVLAALLVLVLVVRPGPFIAAAAVGWLGSWWLLTPAIEMRTPGDLVQIVLFGLAIGASIAAAWMSGRVRDRVRIAWLRAEDRGEALRVTLASIGDAVIATDVRGRISFLNRVAQELTGWTASEAVGRPLDEVYVVLHEQDRQPAGSPVARVLREGRIERQADHKLLLRKDGAERPIADNAAPIHEADGTVRGVVVVFQDVAARRQAEEELQRSERELADFFDHAPVGLRAVGPDGTILRANQAELEMLGYAREEYVGRHIAEFHVEPAAADDLLQRAARGQAVRGQPARMRAKDGSIREVLVSSTPRLEGDRLVYLRCFSRDVTAVHRSRELQRRLAEIVESSEDAIVSQDLDGTIRSWNAAAERLYGYTAAEAIGQSTDLIVPPERREEAEQILERLRRGERTDHFETVRLNRDGRRLDVSLTISPIRDGAGRVIGASRVARDISAQKRAVAALHESEQRFQRLSDAAPVMIWMTGPDRGCTWCSSQWLQFTGRSLADELGHGWVEGVHPEDRDRCLATYAAAFDAREPFSMDYRLRRHDGVYRWILANGVPRLGAEGELLGYIGSCTDITERKQAEVQLRESEARFRSIADSAPVLMWLNDTGGCVFVNRAYLEFLGLERATDVRGYDWAPYIHPEDRADYLARYEECFARHATFEADFRFRRRDGEYRWMHSIGVPRVTEAGEFLGYVGCTFDIHDVRTIAVALRDADRRKDEFLATLAHELRNPLAPIRNALELLHAASGDEQVAAAARATIGRQLDHLVRLVDDLLDVGRITRGKLELRRSRVDLAAVIEQAVEMCRPLLERDRHSLEVALPPEPVQVFADPVRLAQVFGNLLNNACKYSAPAGSIRIEAERLDGEVAVSVQDDGIGIASDELDHIFEMFGRSGRDRSQGGLGIGLALTRRLLELHGGRIEARSEGIGLGSEFVVRLPVFAPGAAEQETPAPLAVPAAAPALPTGTPTARRILVVDDNVDAAQTLAAFLGVVGQQAQVAHDAAQALLRAEAFRPDAVLLDIGLPDGNGYDVCRALRRRTWGREMVVIALTGWGQEEDRRRSREAGFDSHLVKPVDPQLLPALIDDLLARRREAAPAPEPEPVPDAAIADADLVGRLRRLLHDLRNYAFAQRCAQVRGGPAPEPAQEQLLAALVDDTAALLADLEAAGGEAMPRGRASPRHRRGVRRG